MGTLAPLFLLGLAGLAAPLVLHLIRRTPRGRQEFSSLMFLSPSPPRLTRRSRLDQILLLLLRLGALSLLAFAFARPFLRQTALLSLSDLPPRKFAILLDTSASMRRGDLWQQATAEIEHKLKDLNSQDQVALFTFSDRLQEVVPFVDERDKPAIGNPEAIRKLLPSLKPSWASGNLGLALTTLATELDAASDLDPAMGDPQILVISDFEKGNRHDALQAFEWPSRVQVATKVVTPKKVTNAYLQVLESDDASPDPRVRVLSAADSVDDQFFVRWASDDATRGGEETAVYVPPGQSRVLRLPRPENAPSADRIVLRGDDHDFDNTYFVVAPLRQDVTILYAGNDATDDARGLQYYLRLAAASDRLRDVTIKQLDDDSAGALAASVAPHLIVVAKLLSESVERAVLAHVEKGGTLLLVAADQATAETLPRYLNNVSLATSQPEPAEGKYLLLGEIDLGHPLFAPFANPKYGDFTRIHFWRHRAVRVAPDSAARVVARFDNDDPWLLEQSRGAGRIMAVTSGWQPDESQLALSSKFVPLVGGILDRACGTTESLAGVDVNQRVEVPKPKAEAQAVRLPDGRETSLAANAQSFAETEQPGLYRLGSASEPLRFAVNLASSESETSPIDQDQLKQLGVPIGAEVSKTELLDRKRQEQDVELESRQKVWRWMLVACLGLLIMETWLAGRNSRLTGEMTRAAA